MRGSWFVAGTGFFTAEGCGKMIRGTPYIFRLCRVDPRIGRTSRDRFRAPWFSLNCSLYLRSVRRRGRLASRCRDGRLRLGRPLLSPSRFLRQADLPAGGGRHRPLPAARNPLRSGAVHVDPSERGQGSGDAMQLILKSDSLFVELLNYSGHGCHLSPRWMIAG
jgi:hypothetical protein